MGVITINPATEAQLATYEFMNQSTWEGGLKEGLKSQRTWAKVSVEEKIRKFEHLKKLLMAHQEEYAVLMANEMGKPLTQGRSEIDKCGRLCDYYAKEAAGFLKSEPIKTDYSLSERTFAPIGLVLGIMPWNYPFWQVFRFVVPNLMVGNGAVLKHAPNVTGCGLAIERLFQEADFLPKLMQTILIDVPDIAKVIHHPTVQGVTITGSNRAGQAVAMEAGRALKKIVLELGGSDPYLILDDADLKNAAQACVQSRLGNAGQVCIAAKRILVNQAIEKPFTELVLELAKTYPYGDPLAEGTKMGPLARLDLRQLLEGQVKKLNQEGAQCLMGGVTPQEKGYYYPATLMTHVSPESVAFHEELFGPVICITSVKSEEEAIRLANITPYGLGAAVFSENLKRAEAVALQLEVGACAVNMYVASDPRLPFGGTKQSGFGRELALEGMREFVNIKTLMVR